MRPSLVFAAPLLCLALACSGDDSPAESDAMVTSIDARDEVADAAPIDAFDLCPGELFFTGEYIDWESSEMMFRGIPGATFTVIGDEVRTAMTAPNGRVVVCLAPATDVNLTIEHATYLDALYAADAEAASAGMFSIRGMTQARLDQLFTDLTVTQDAGEAMVMVSAWSYPELAPVLGASVTVAGRAPYDPFTFASDATLGASGVLFVPNIAVGGGSTTVALTPPGAETCVGPTTVPLAAGQVTYVTFACSN